MKTRRLPVKVARKAWTSTLIDIDQPVANATWYLINGYVYRYEGQGVNRKWFLLHREVIQADPGKKVDHANRNKLDNRRENLRIATSQQNVANSVTPKRGTKGRVSHYRGVSPQRSKSTWIAKIGSEQSYLGTFTTEEDAARAYNAAAVDRYGEFAMLNDIEK